MFIGRQSEIHRLSQRYQSNKKEFIAITGKKGIGKTELLIKSQSLIEKEDVIFKLIGKKGQPLKRQLENADFTFEKTFNKTIKSKNWADFFEKFSEEIKDREEKVFFLIDEFPWFNTKGSYFIDEFGAFWNHYVENNLKIIITGSAVSWISKNVFRNVGGLYHKVTCSIKLKPFNLLETSEYLLRINGNFSNNELVEYYLMTGGVARYLQNINIADSIKENRNTIYQNNYFIDFFDNSFSSNNRVHEQIVKLFSNRLKLTSKEIIEKLKVSIPTILKSLEELVETDILMEIKNYKSADKLYMLNDLFFFNYLRKDNPINKGLSFEILLINNIDLFLNGKGDFSLSKWNGKNAQIDLLLEFESKDFLIVEAKYYNDVYQFNHEEEVKIINRIESFKNENHKKRSFVNIMLATMYGSKNKTSTSYIDFSLDKFLTEKLISFRE